MNMNNSNSNSSNMNNHGNGHNNGSGQCDSSTMMMNKKGRLEGRQLFPPEDRQGSCLSSSIDQGARQRGQQAERDMFHAPSSSSSSSSVNQRPGRFLHSKRTKYGSVILPPTSTVSIQEPSPINVHLFPPPPNTSSSSSPSPGGLKGRGGSFPPPPLSNTFGARSRCQSPVPNAAYYQHAAAAKGGRGRMVELQKNLEVDEYHHDGDEHRDGDGYNCLSTTSTDMTHGVFGEENGAALFGHLQSTNEEAFCPSLFSTGGYDDCSHLFDKIYVKRCSNKKTRV
jgi:hypothetical protein